MKFVKIFLLKKPTLQYTCIIFTALGLRWNLELISSNCMSLIRNDVTKQNGRSSVGTFVCAPMEIVDHYTNSEVFESAEDHRLIGINRLNGCVSFQ